MKTKKNVSEMIVEDVMTKRVETLSPIDTIKDAVNLMLDSKLTTVPIIDGSSKCVGVLSRSDLTEMFLQEDGELSNALDTDRLSVEWLNRSLDTSEARQVKDLMTYDIVTARAGQSLNKVCQAMVARNIHHLPVVDERGAVIGIVSSFDIVSAVAEA